MVNNKLKLLTSYLEKEQRNKIIVLIGLIFFGLIFETFGLGILLPLLILILDYDKFLIYIENWLPNAELKYISQSNIILYSFIIVGLIYGFKALFFIYVTYFQNKIVFSISKKVKSDLHRNYLECNLSDHNNSDFSTKIKNLQIEVNHFIGYIQAILATFTEGLFNSGLFILLIIVDPLQAIIILIFFGVFVGISFFSTRPFLKRFSELKMNLNNSITSLIIDHLENYKTIYLTMRQNFFVNKFDFFLEKMMNVNIKSNTLKSSPRFVLEFFVVLLLLLILIVKLKIGISPTQIITSLGLFGAALFKVFPSINKIISSTQQINNFKPMFDLILGELNHFNKGIKKNTNNISLNKKLALQNISFSYPNSQMRVLNKIKLIIEKGNFIGVVGESGSGKTTLLEILMGFRQQLSGSYLIDNNEIYDPSVIVQSRIFRYLPQEVKLIKGTIAENIAFGYESDKIDQEKLINVISQTKLDRFIESLPNGIDTIIGDKNNNLSGGQRQRIGLARILYDEPKIILLDEPTSALDSKTEQELIKNILKLGLTTILVTHNKKLLSFCDDYIELDMQNSKRLISNISD